MPNRKLLPLAVFVASAAMSLNASAGIFPVIDVALIQTVSMMSTTVTSAVNGTTTAVSAMNTSVSQLLQKIGTSVNENGQKISSTIEADGKSQREFSVGQEKNRKLEEARQRYFVGSNICSESASGGANEIAGSAQAAKGGMRPGGGAKVSNKAIAQALNSPPIAPEVDSSRAAKVHAQFCDADDYAAYGGAQACPGVSTSMPGADKRVDSVLSGAGENGKAPDLTFNQDQIDAARMYVQNSTRRSIAPQLKKGEADTVAGSQYVGLMNQYNAMISAAADPQEQRIANSQPSPATKDLLKEAMISPAAAAYYKEFASETAKSTGMMSAREFEAFEVGRRYANTEYQADLQSLSGENLQREQIRIASLNNWLMLGIKDELQKTNIIGGQLLASAARDEYAPILGTLYKSVSGRMGGQ
ncbi:MULTISPECIES: conjugal transfer protein TraW [unclassified Pseudomonas]|uniref:conjugal transfer protein TraW n=1 Tax=unclassified Pseudomonas TaxID=196821 RepID=UPI000C2FEC53|nr:MULTISPECIES: conjugal transfer protein TraW [unclassified Pseudomonas]MCU1737537.1 conjugal transfer protein TraW [Pseudomonas sp. 20S_6.2_Bac1]